MMELGLEYSCIQAIYKILVVQIASGTFLLEASLLSMEMFSNVVKKGLGLLATDSLMFEDKRTKPFVELYATNESKFFEDFGHAMRKVSVLNVKVGKKGEVRNRCDSFNNLDTN
ncbi:unnamed protein product [Vicia faba]|uniref:peroxidase n=1 Tax=Vicia faba TaxID=3906 RepID=A0AAV0YRU6_VICFA|nr:unnamed protein product [Vicia faba]